MPTLTVETRTITVTSGPYAGEYVTSDPNMAVALEAWATETEAIHSNGRLSDIAPMLH